MSKEYIPVATSATIYHEPQTKEELEALTEKMNLGDMVFNKWVFPANGGMWYTMGLMDENDPDSKMLFPNIVMNEPLKPLKRWGMARKTFLEEHKKFQAMQLGTVGLHKHCLEIEEQATERKRSMMAAIQQDPANKVTNSDKNADPMAWAQRMNNFQAKVHETIYNDLIYA